MRFSLEVWILVAILWTQVLVSVGVYVGQAPVTSEDRSGRNGGSNRRDNSQTTDNPTGSRSNSDRRSSSETMGNIEGPISGMVSEARLPGVHCVELRSKRYISDGFCTSTRPIMEVLCTGSCIPEPQMLWYYEHLEKVYGKNKSKEYRCVNDHVRQKKVTLICDNGQTRTYRIKTVRSCKCKRLQHQHNQSQRTSSNVSARLVPNRNRANRNNRQ